MPSLPAVTPSVQVRGLFIQAGGRLVQQGLDFDVRPGEVLVIMGATHGKAAAGFAPIAIGLALTLIHLISIPITNTSVNPARSTGVALFAGSGAISQLWLFWLAPLVGGVIGGGLYAWLRPAND